MSNQKLLSRFFLLILIMEIVAGPELKAAVVELKGNMRVMNGGKPMTVILKYVADESFNMSANVDQEGHFSFKVDVPVAGRYTLRFGRGIYDVILTAKEKTVTVDITLDQLMPKDVVVENSPENDAYKACIAATASNDSRLRAHFMNCSNEDSCEAVLHKLLTDYAAELTQIMNKYPGTYAAEVLCRMRMPAIARNIKSTSSEFRKMYFDNVPFSDSTIFNTLIFQTMVMQYMEYLSGTSISGESQFIKSFTERIKSNPVVLHKSAIMLFEELMKNKREKMMQMFIDWYNTGDNKKAINHPVLDMRLNNISKVMPGQPYTEILSPDTGGAIRSLREVIDKSKCTLLLFWSSECSHCREELPFIKEYYGKYHSKGFNIYAVSLEPNPEKWKQYIVEKGLTWTNVITNQQANPNPAIDYVATSTPTLILIDGKGRILHRFIPKSRLEAHITEALR